MNGLLSIKKCRIALLAVLTVFLIGMSSANAMYLGYEYLLDDARVLTEEEEIEIAGHLYEVSRKYDMVVGIAVEPELSGESPQQMADDVLDSYLEESPNGGIMLYICLDNGESERRYHFSTVRGGKSAINQRGLTYLEKKVVPHLKDSDFAAAFEEYADTVDELFGMAADGEPYNKVPTSTLLIVWGSVIALTLIISIAMLASKMKMMKTAKKKNYAREYMKEGSLNITSSNDIFLYSIVTQTEIPKNDSGDHTSSSGESHGGTGGSF